MHILGKKSIGNIEILYNFAAEDPSPLPVKSLCVELVACCLCFIITVYTA